MADDIGIKTRQTTTNVGLDRTEISQKFNFGEFKTIREVVTALAQLRQARLPITSNGSLYQDLRTIYASFGERFEIDLKKGSKETVRIENELLTRIANLGEEAGNWVEQNIDDLREKVGEEELKNKALNKQDLQTLLDDQERAIAERQDRQVISKELAKKYGVDRGQVDEWLERVSILEQQAKENGLSKEVARDIAERGVVREVRMVGELVEIAGVNKQKATEISRKVISETINSGKKVDSNVVVRIVGKTKIDKEGQAFLLKQSMRLDNESKVLALVDKEARTFTKSLSENITIAQPSINFDRHRQVVESLTKQAIERVWNGESDSLMSAEIVLRDGNTIRRVDYTEAVKEVLGSNNGAIDVAIREGSGLVNTEIGQNMALATSFEFVKNSEGVTDEILKYNPNLKIPAVVRYSEAVTRATMPILPPGQRIGRELSGEYGQNETVGYETNLILRVVSGVISHRELVVEVKEAETNGIGIEEQLLTSRGRTTESFVASLRKNPLLDRGISTIVRRASKSLITNTVAIEGATSFVANSLGVQAIFGVQTATAIPVVMGYFGAGGTMGGIISEIVTAGSFQAWANGALMAAGATAETVGVGATEAGALVATTATAGTGVAGTAAGATGILATLQALPVVGQIIAGAVALIGGIKLAFKGIGAGLAKLGIDVKKFNFGLKIKKFFREDLNLGKFGDLIALPVAFGGFLLSLPFVALGTAFASLSAMLAPVIVAVVIGLFVYQTLVPNQLASSLVPTSQMLSGEIGNRTYANVDPIFGENCEMTLACVAMEALTQNGFVRVVRSNVLEAANTLRKTISKYSFFDVARFIMVMTYNTTKFGAFQCIGFSIAADTGLTASPSWEKLYAGTQPGCVKVAPTNAGVGDHIVFPLRNGHYHIGVLTVVRPDRSGIMYDVNTDGNGSLHKWPIFNIVEFVGGNNSRNPGHNLTILRCGG